MTSHKHLNLLLPGYAQLTYAAADLQPAVLIQQFFKGHQLSQRKRFVNKENCEFTISEEQRYAYQKIKKKSCAACTKKEAY